MNLIGFIAVLLFGVGWLGCVVTWFYAAAHVLRASFTIDGWNGEREHGRKAFRGGLAFIGCWAFAFCNGSIGVWFGGWQAATGH